MTSELYAVYDIKRERIIEPGCFYPEQISDKTLKEKVQEIIQNYERWYL